MHNAYRIVAAFLFLTGILTSALPAIAADYYDLVWHRESRPANFNRALDIATDDSGNNYAVGVINRISDDPATADIYVVAYDSDGSLQWSKQEGTNAGDGAACVTLGGSGNVFVSGYTAGGLDGSTKLGDNDGFLIKYDRNGTKLWTRQFGTAYYDTVRDMATDSNGNSYLVGESSDSSGGRDLAIYKFDGTGSLKWTQVIDKTYDIVGSAVALDNSGAIYIAGNITGDFPGSSGAEDMDIMVYKIDPSGNTLWSKQLGTSAVDYVTSMAYSDNDGLYLYGETYGSFSGFTNAGGNDLFLLKLNTNSNQIWVDQKGTQSYDYAYRVAIDGSDGDIVATADAWGDLTTGLGADFPYHVILEYTKDAASRIIQQQTGHIYTGIDSDSNGHLYVAGHSPAYDFIVTKFASLPVISAITSPASNAILPTSSTTIQGTAEDRTGTGVNLVEVSTDGGATWGTGYDLSGVGDWTTWGFDWISPSAGEHDLKSRAYNVNGDIEPLRDGVTVFVDGDTPLSTITDPKPNAMISADNPSYVISGTASDALSGVDKVEVSIDGGPWQAATGTTDWTYEWSVPVEGVYSIRTRATDEVGNVETAGAGVVVYVSSLDLTYTQNGRIVTLNAVLSRGGAPGGLIPLKFYYSVDGGLTWVKKGGGRTLEDGTLAKNLKLAQGKTYMVKAAYAPRGYTPLDSAALDCDLTPVVAVSPMHEALTTEANPTATWLPFAGATGYVLQTCASKSFKADVVETADLGLVTSGQLPALAAGQSVYWRVVALIPAGRSVGSVPRRITRN